MRRFSGILGIAVLLLCLDLNGQNSYPANINGIVDQSALAMNSLTVATLPQASASTGLMYWVQDGASNTDCSNGGGVNLVACKSNGTVWLGQPLSSSAVGSFATAPINSVSTCAPGQFSYDNTYLYQCLGANSWVAISRASFPAAPILTSIMATAVSGTSETITWTTDQNASGYVTYGTSASYGSTSSGSSAVTSHSASITGLTCGSTYHYQAISASTANGRSNNSGDLTFVTTSCGGSNFLGSLPSPLAAYGLRQLSTSYAGKLINVERSSDSTTTDIGFVSGGDLDTSTLATFCGSGSCRVMKAYDQSGHNLNAVQVTFTLAPVIYNAGALVTLNGEPVMRFQTTSGSQTGLFATSSTPISSNALEAITVGTLGANAINYSSITYLTDSSSDSPSATAGLAELVVRHMTANTVEFIANNATNSPYLTYIPSTLFWADTQFSGTTGTMTVDSTSSTGAIPSGINATVIALCSGPSPATSATGVSFLSEFELWGVALTSTQESSAHANQKAYWGTP